MLGRWLVWLALLVLPSNAQAAVQRFALVVGNNHGHAPDLELRHAESDAGKVAQVLRDLGQFEPGDIVVLRGEAAGTVRSTLIALNDRIRAAQSVPGQQVLLFVYYSGHADAQSLRLGTTRLALRELAQLVRGSPANFRLLVLDACRSGALTRLKGGRVVAPFALTTDSTLPGEGMAFLTASAENEDAQESDEIKSSFFTNAFVSGLLGAADRDGDGAVTLDEVYTYARDATLRSTSKTFAGPQHPSFQFELRGHDSLVLTTPGLRPSERGQLIFPRGIRFLVMARDESGKVVAELESTAATPRLSLRPGRYYLRGRAADYLLEGELQVRAGQSKRVEPADLTRVAYARMVRKGWGERTISHSLALGASWRLPLPNSETPCWGLAADYRAELRALTLGARLGACRSGFENRAIAATTDEYSARATLRYVLDYRIVSLALGMDAGLAVTRQSFEGVGPPPTRWAQSPLGALAIAASVPFGSRYFAALEGLAELELMRFQESALTDPRLRWALAPCALLSLGLQL